MDATTVVPEPVVKLAATCGTDVPTYARDRPGMSAFVMEGGGAVTTSTVRAESGVTVAGINTVRANAGSETSERRAAERTSRRTFFGVSVLLFAASAAATIHWCGSMSAMGEMSMAGGWTMSMAWTRMPGQTWPGAAVSFLGMWVVMMVAMMLPSLVPMLWRYRRAVGGKGNARMGRLTALVGTGYFFVWTVFGMAAFALGVALAAVEMQSSALARAAPSAVGAVVLMAGLLQFTAWKARRLACCRKSPGAGGTLPPDGGTAWRQGLRLGLHCVHCCFGLTAALLGLGVMDLRAMAVVAAAITAERLAPAGERVARAIGVLVVGAGSFLIARAVGLG